MGAEGLVVGADSRPRCWWGADPPDYAEYHDSEWGFPLTDDQRLFEKVCLEGFQAGLSWLTVLRKRSRFREVFARFDPTIVSRFDDSDVARLLADPGIIRHQGKIRSTINNAARALELVEEFGSLASYFWRYAEFGGPPIDLPTRTEASDRIARDLKQRGWSFVGSTTIHAFMQAVGLVNAHLSGCWVRENAEKARVKTVSMLNPSRESG